MFDALVGPLEVVIEQRGGRPLCAGRGTPAVSKDRDEVILADLPCLGRRARLGAKHRWQSARRGSQAGSKL